MIVYLIPIVFLLYLLLKDVSFNKRIYFLLWGIISFIAVFRYNIGTDYIFYKDIFEWNSRGDAVELVGHLYYYLSRIIDRIGGDYSWMIFFSALFLSYSVFKIFSIFVPENRLYFAMLIYLTCGMYFSSYNIFRQYLAASCFMLAIYFYTKKRFLFMLAIFLMAVLFHSATIIASVLFIFYKFLKSDDLTFKIVAIGYLVSIALIFVDIQELFRLFSFALPHKYASYLNNETLFLNRNRLAVLKLIVPNITMIWLLFRYKIILRLNLGREIVLGMVLYVCLNNAFYGIISLTRLSELFFIFVPLSTALLIESYKESSEDLVMRTKNAIPLISKLNDEHFLTLGFSTYYLILTVVTIFIMNGNGVIPYQIIFLK